MKVSKIKLSGFRGATVPIEIPIDVSKSVTLIFGENASGKSTIADAFDFLCNGNYGSLESYSLGGERKRYLASLGCDLSEVKVTLECGNNSWTARVDHRQYEGNISQPPKALILRRKSILKVIEAQPRERFEELKTFVAVPVMESSEASLREAIRVTQSNLNEYTNSLSHATRTIEQMWKDDGEPGGSALQWAEQETSKDAALLQKGAEATDIMLSALTLVESSINLLDDTRQNRDQAQAKFSEAEQKLRDAETEHLQHSSELLQLLRGAKDYISTRPATEDCPVCENKISVSNLQARLDSRISGMQTLSELLEIKSQAKRDVDESVAHVNQRLDDVCGNATSLKAALANNDLPKEARELIETNRWLEFVTALDSQAEIENKTRQLVAGVTTFPNFLRQYKESAQKSITLQNALRTQLNTYAEKKDLARSEEVTLRRLNTILEVVSTERKNYVEQVLRSISGDVERLYSQLHPGESLGGIRFYLRPNMIGSLEFDAQFHGVADHPPQAYYSESHLDTLGICIFLALAKLFTTDNTVVILDDVLTSVDAQHLGRFMDMLHAEAPNLGQVIATTHYRPWRDRYRWARAPVANTQLIELGPWTLDKGIRTSEFQSALSELRSELVEDRFDRQASSSKAGIILESLLDFVTLKYRCRVPRNARNEYTLGDLTKGIDSRLSNLLRSSKTISENQTETNQIKPLIDAAASAQWIRNTVGCHFNLGGSEVSDGEVKRFCENVVVLSDALICNHCGMLPVRKPSGSYWQCGCGRLELYPLIHPDADPTVVDDEA